MPSIDGASIRKILDSRGNATIEVEIRAANVTGRAAAPSGASTGAHEPKAFPEGGVDEAIRIFRESVGPRIEGREVSDQAGLDRTLREIDGTRNFARIGCNVATAVSLANAKAAAAASGTPLFRYLGGRCRLAAKSAGFAVQPALDLAASEFFRNGKYRYRERTISPEEQVGFVERLARDYGLFSVEDPFDQEDFGAFADLTRRIGDRCKVIGDDIFVTNVERLQRGIELRAGNAILIKPNQIGTLSETRAAVDLAHKSGFATVMSHRSGETTDDTIAHLAVAFGCLGIKTGAVGGERIAKLNELIRIEEQLQAGA